MKVKEFQSLFAADSAATYSNAVFGTEKKVKEANIAEKLFANLKTGIDEQIILGYFTRLTSNVQESPDPKVVKFSSRLLKKADTAFTKEHKALLSADAVTKIDGLIHGGKKAEKQRKDDKEAKKALAKQAAPQAAAAAAGALEPLPENYGRFPEEECLLSNLKARATVLRANNFKEAEALSDKGHALVKKNPGRALLEANKERNKAALAIAGADFSGTNTVLGGQQFILASCPRSASQAASLVDAVLKRNGSLLVSTLESTDAGNKFNNFWREDRVPQLILRDGWTLQYVSKTVLATGPNAQVERPRNQPQIVETTLLATKGDTTRVVTHLHYEGWIDRTAAPNEELMMKLLQRMQELSPNKHAPIAINCHGGVGRTGGTCVEYGIFRHIDAELLEGRKLSEISLNIPETLFKTRMQGRDILHQESLLAQVYAVTGAYYEHLQTKENVREATELPVEPACNLIAAYT